MEEHIVKIISINQITPDVNGFTVNINKYFINRFFNRMRRFIIFLIN